MDSNIIGFDFDCVIFDYSPAIGKYIAKYRKDLNLAGYIGDLKHFNLSDEELRKLLDDFADSEEMANGGAIPGAKEGIMQLILEGYELHIITKRTEREMSSCRIWTMQNISEDLEIHTVRAFGKYKRKVTKGNACKSLNASTLVDDLIENCRSARDEYIEAILFDPENQGKAEEGIILLSSFPSVVEHILNKKRVAK